MFVPEIERHIGIETYLTQANGIGGKIRASAENFVVEELLVDGSKAIYNGSAVEKPALGATKERQHFLLCVLVKRNWDTFIASKNIAKELGVESNKVQIAGIKDAKAVTSQYITLEGVTAEDVARVKVRDVTVFPVGYFREALCPFYLLGNNFKIAISDVAVSAEAAKEAINNVYSELEAAGGIPNFYGHQRFGTTRAITHAVGKAMVQGDLKEAAMQFLAKPSIHEHPNSRQVRAALQETGNFKQAFQDYPMQLRFERVMLKHLAEQPDDFAGAFRWLPLKLRLLFVQAWQSYLFNRFLSARIKAGYSLVKAEIGDFVVGVERNGLPMPKANRPVTAKNVDEVNRLVGTGKLRVALPIFGATQKLSSGVMGELEQQLLADEGVSAEGFLMPVMPELAARGELRAAVCPVKNFTSTVEGECARLEFTLLKSAYATVLLREVMKPQDLIAAGY